MNEYLSDEVGELPLLIRAALGFISGKMASCFVPLEHERLEFAFEVGLV